MGQLPEFVDGQRLDPAKRRYAIDTVDIDTIEEQHGKMNIEIRSCTKLVPRTQPIKGKTISFSFLPELARGVEPPTG